MNTMTRLLFIMALGLVSTVARTGEKLTYEEVEPSCNPDHIAAQNNDLEHSTLTPHMDVPIQEGQNIIFCSTFQIAWNQLKQEIIKEDIQLEKPVDMLPFLNKGLFTEADLPAEGYLAMAGYVRDDIAGRINQTLREKFGNRAPQIQDTYRDPEVIVAYAFLNRQLQFVDVFENLWDPMAFYAENKKSYVAGFGIQQFSDKPEHRKLRDQVEILSYVNHGDFIIRLKANSDEIILANVQPEKTLLATFEKVDARVAGSTSALLENKDILQIPKFDFSINRSYETLLGLHLRNKNFEDYFIAEALQDIRFALNETGAEVCSAGRVVLKKGGHDFRKLIFDQPFLLYIRTKDGKYPYFAIWVENSELMVHSH